MNSKKYNSKQKLTVYLTKPIVFKKQSQTIQTAIKDKQILVKKKQILKLNKNNIQIKHELISNRQKYQNQRQKHKDKLTQLQTQQKQANDYLLKIKIRKLRIQAIQKQQIKHCFANQLKKYLLTWAQYKKFNFILSVGGIKRAKICAWITYKTQIKYLINPQIKKTILTKNCNILYQSNKLRNICLMIKKNTYQNQHQNTYQNQHQHQNNIYCYKLEIFATKGKYFYLQRLLTANQFQTKIQLDNPLKNLILMPNTQQILFLNQYFQIQNKIKKIERILKIYKFQIDVLKQKKKIQFKRCLQISNFFQTIYSIPGYQNLKMKVFISIKIQHRIKQKQQQTLSRSIIMYSRQKVSHQDQDGKQKQKQEIYEFFITPINSYDEKYMFTIKDNQILNKNKNKYQNCLQQFLDKFTQRYMIQLTRCSYKKQKQSQNKRNNSNISYFDSQKYHMNQIKNQYENNGSQRKPRIVQIIQYHLPINLIKVIKIQSFIKMIYLKKRYLKKLKDGKKNNDMALFFMNKISGNILVSTYIRKQELIFFIQCLSLSGQKANKIKQFLRFHCKYWKLVQNFMKSSDFMRAINKCLIWEIQEQIALLFQEAIIKNEKQQQNINTLKPIKAINRLRKLFIHLKLKLKIRKNILFIRKFQKQFATLVLIIRRSTYLKNMSQVHLYVLKNHTKKLDPPKDIRTPTQIRLYLQQFKNTNKIVQIQNKKKYRNSCQFVIAQNRKIRYKSICMYNQNVTKLIESMKQLSTFSNFTAQQSQKNNKISKTVQSQFYISQNYFMLKPLHIQFITGEFRFIQRFSSINLQSDEMLNQLQNTSLLRNQKQHMNSEYYQHKNSTLNYQKNVSKKSIASTKFNNKNQIIIQDNSSQQNLVYYCLYKDKKQIFNLELFTIIDNGTRPYFKQAYKQQISKKQITTSGWMFIYKIVGQWAKNTGRCSNFQFQYKKNTLKDMQDHYYIASNNSNYTEKQKQNDQLLLSNR